MEFLSEDLYGDPQSIQDVVNQLGNVNPNELYNLQQNLQQLQFLNPSLFGNFPTVNQLSGIPTTNPADPNSYGGMINGQAIMNQVGQNLTNIGADNPYGQPTYSEIDDAIRADAEFLKFVEDTLAQEEYQRFIMRNFFDTSDLDEGAELPEFNDMQDDTYQMILDSILGRASEVPPEIRGDALKTQEWLNNQLTTIGQQIADAGGYEAWLAQQGGGEEIVDPNESTLPGDTTSEGGDTTAGGGDTQEEESESWTDRLSNWWQSVLNNIGGGASGSSGPPTLPGSAGVIITPSTMGTPGSWRVFLPGMIPGLPSSPTIIGTVEDILNAPGRVLSDLWDQIEARVQDPIGYLEDIINGNLDPDGLVTIGGISAVVNEIIDDLFEGDPNNVDPTTGEQTGDGTSVGGTGDDTNTNEELNLRNDDEILNQVGGSGEVTFDNETPELGGAGVDVNEGSGGGGGGRVASPESGQDYMYRLSYNPGAPMQVPGGMMMPTMPQMPKPVDSNSVLDGLLTRLIS